MYTDILQLILFLFIVTLFIGLYIRVREGVKSPFLFVFIILSTISGAFFNDIYIDSSYIIRLCFPFITPMFLALGPSLYIHYRASSNIKTDHLYHFLPSILLVFEHIVYSMIKSEQYTHAIRNASLGNFTNINISFFFSSTFEFLVYPLVTMVYASIICYNLLTSKHTRVRDGLFLLAATIVCLTPILENVIYYYFYQTELIRFISVDASRILLGIILLPLIIHTYLFHNKRTSIPFSKQLSSVQPLERYINEQMDDPNTVLLTPGIKKDEFIRNSSFDEEMWELYSKNTGLNYTDLKKKVRIAHALRLINEGYLQQYNIDALSKAIGYRSRTSFYNAYEEITGSKFKASDNHL